MNKWIKQGMIGLALTSASVAAAVGQGEDKGQELNAVESLGNHSIDAQDYAGGSKLKDRMIQATGMSVEFAVVEKINA